MSNDQTLTPKTGIAAQLSQGKAEEAPEPAPEPATTPEGSLEFMWQAFSNLNEWVRFSDAKAAAVLAADGVIAGGLATILMGTRPVVLKTDVAAVWMCAVAGFTFYSAAYALLSLLPQLKVSGKPASGSLPSSEESGSLIFFADIDKHFPTWRDFHSKINNALADPDRAVEEISQQVWCNSKVAVVKYKRIEMALFGLSGAVVVGFAGIVVLAFGYLIKTRS